MNLPEEQTDEGQTQEQSLNGTPSEEAIATFYDDSDPWSNYYLSRSDSELLTFHSTESITCHAIFQTATSKVKDTWRTQSPTYALESSAEPPTTKHLPILIDSGASGTVVGMAWLMSWTQNHDELRLLPSTKSFRFGDGRRYPSLGTCCVKLMLPTTVADLDQPWKFTITADAVQSPIPCLISKKSLVAVKGRLDFPSARLEIDSRLTSQLRNLPSGHISLPAIPLNSSNVPYPSEALIPPLINYPLLTEPALQPISDAQLIKIHKHLSHCSEFALTNLLKLGHRVVHAAQIQKILRRCTCHGVVGRVTPPKVTAWAARFNG